MLAAISGEARTVRRKADSERELVLRARVRGPDRERLIEAFQPQIAIWRGFTAPRPRSTATS
jgi:hypothetical protein